MLFLRTLLPRTLYPLLIAGERDASSAALVIVIALNGLMFPKALFPRTLLLVPVVEANIILSRDKLITIAIGI